MTKAGRAAKKMRREPHEGLVSAREISYDSREPLSALASAPEFSTPLAAGHSGIRKQKTLKEGV